MLKAEEVMREYPFRDLPADHAGIFAPDNGCINVPLVLRTLFRLAQGSACTRARIAVGQRWRLLDHGYRRAADGAGQALHSSVRGVWQ
jgi:hypothetical protein